MGNVYIDQIHIYLSFGTEFEPHITICSQKYEDRTRPVVKTIFRSGVQIIWATLGSLQKISSSSPLNSWTKFPSLDAHKNPLPQYWFLVGLSSNHLELQWATLHSHLQWNVDWLQFLHLQLDTTFEN